MMSRDMYKNQNLFSFNHDKDIIIAQQNHGHAKAFEKREASPLIVLLSQKCRPQ